MTIVPDWAIPVDGAPAACPSNMQQDTWAVVDGAVTANEGHVAADFLWHAMVVRMYRRFRQLHVARALHALLTTSCGGTFRYQVSKFMLSK